MPLNLLGVDVGSSPGDETGDEGRVAFQKLNVNSALIAGAMEDAEIKAFVVKCVAKDVAVEVEAAVEWWRQPYSLVLLAVRAAVFEEQSGGDIVIDILEDGVSVLDSNMLVIPADSDTSVGHSPAPYIYNIILNDNSKMTIDVIDVGTGATAKGLEVTLIGFVIWTSF
jgi:hypothetical protein